MKILKIGFSFLSLFAFTSSIQAADSLDIAINEIAWMGTEASYNDEWIELYNNTNEAINLDSWSLGASDGTPNITLAGMILAKGFFILERTDDDTLPKILADQIYTGALGNSGEDLKLLDNSGSLIDSVDCSGSWFTGDNATKQTMEKTSTGWQTSQSPGGTPKTENSVVVQIQDEPAIDDSHQQPQELGEVELPPTYASGIVFNEILPSPDGPDAEEEWIELYNQNSFPVLLSGWKLEDSIGQINTFTFSESYQIAANGFLVLNRPTTKIVLNNDEDGLKLIQPNEVVVEQIAFKNALRGQSYSRTKDNNWLWTSVLTPEAENIPPVLPNTESNQESPSEPISLNNQELAAIGEQETTPVNYYLFLFALLIAFLTGILIFVLKKKVDFKKKLE